MCYETQKDAPSRIPDGGAGRNTAPPSWNSVIYVSESQRTQESGRNETDLHPQSAAGSSGFGGDSGAAVGALSHLPRPSRSGWCLFTKPTLGRGEEVRSQALLCWAAFLSGTPFMGHEPLEVLPGTSGAILQLVRVLTIIWRF